MRHVPATLWLALMFWTGLCLGAAVAQSLYPYPSGAGDADTRSLMYRGVDPAIRNWVKGLRDKNGVGCCDTADGFPVEYDWDTANGRYRVFIEGQWHDVPDEALLDEPNKLGYATVWWIPERQLDGTMKPKIRCFLPGAGG